MDGSLCSDIPHEWFLFPNFNLFASQRPYFFFFCIFWHRAPVIKTTFSRVQEKSSHWHKGHQIHQERLFNIFPQLQARSHHTRKKPKLFFAVIFLVTLPLWVMSKTFLLYSRVIYNQQITYNNTEHQSKYRTAQGKRRHSIVTWMLGYFPRIKEKSKCNLPSLVP